MLRLGFNNTLQKNTAEELYNNILYTSVADFGIDTSRLRLRRDSDNNEQEFDPVSGKFLDTTSINAWAGSSSVYVTKIFDKTGNENHAIQTSASFQPRLIDSGTYEVDSDGNYSLFFDGVDDFMDVTNNQGLDITTGNVSVLCQHDPNNQIGYTFTKNGESSGDMQYGHFWNTSATLVNYNGGFISNDGNNQQISKVNVTTYDHINSKMYLNGNLVDTDAFTQNLSETFNVQIACRSNSADGSVKAVFYKGHIGRIIVFNEALSSSQVKLLSARV